MVKHIQMKMETRFGHNICSFEVEANRVSWFLIRSICYGNFQEMNSPLHNAPKTYGRFDIVELLIKNGANVNARNKVC